MKFTILVDPFLVIVTIRLFCMDQRRWLFNEYINFTPSTPKLPPLGGVSWNLQFLVSFPYTCICNILNLDKIDQVVSEEEMLTDDGRHTWSVMCHSGVDTAKYEMSYSSLKTFCVTVGLTLPNIKCHMVPWRRFVSQWGWYCQTWVSYGSLETLCVRVGLTLPNVSVIWILGDVMCHSGCDNAKCECNMDPWRRYVSQWVWQCQTWMSYGSFEMLCVTVGLTLPNVNVIWILGDVMCHSGVDTAKCECHMDPWRRYVSQWEWHYQMWVSYGSLETLCVTVGVTLPNVKCYMDSLRCYVSQWGWHCQTWMSYGSFEKICVTVGLTLPNVNVIWILFCMNTICMNNFSFNCHFLSNSSA